MNDSENNMDKYFKNLTDRERAIFEGGISMGSLYHQFVGTPVNLDTCPMLEKAIEESIMLQPAVIDVVVKLDKQLIKEATVVSTYTSLEGNMLNIEITTKINEEVVTTCISYNQELDYPLMYIKD
jgi:hypothetical protein